VTASVVPPLPEDGGQHDLPADPVSVARAICLRLLTDRQRTRAELATVLRRKRVPDEAARTVLDRFAEVGLIDDAAIAENYALVQHRQRGLAARAVAGKLRQRGLDEDTIRTALMPIDASSEQAAASALVARKLPALRHLEPRVQARRMYGLLARRGYSAAIANTVITALLSHTEYSLTNRDEWWTTDDSSDSDVSG
jgi:regulatory protein